MLKKKILTLENLIEFCEQQNFNSFDSKETGYQLSVQVPAVFDKEESEDDSLLLGTVKLMHCGRNKNRSNLTEEGLKNSASTVAYKPILANFTDVNGELDFTSHDFEFNDDGSIIYYEKQVGCFTADKPYIEQDSEHEDRKYLFAKCAIPRNYTAAADIIERKGGTKLSAELGVNKMSYDSKEKELILEDIVVLGATLLGVDPVSGEEIGEGMEGARLDIADFSAENNSVMFNKAELIDEITQAVMNRLDNHINNDQRKEEHGLEFDENKVDETIKEENIELNETIDEETQVTETEASEKVEEEVTEETPEVVDEFDGEDTTDNDSEEEEPEDAITDDGVLNNGQQKKYSIDKTVSFNGEVKTFSSTLMEKLNALYELVNSTYGESDNAWYDVDALDDEKIVYMHDYWNGKHYRQSYQVKKDVYSLKGDRTEVFCTYLSKDEQAQLESMKSNYSDISDKLAKYESEPEKVEVLNSADYTSIAGTQEFEDLKKRENYFNLTVDEVKDKADAILLQYAKAGRLNFAADTSEKREEPKKDFFAFARVEHNSSFLDGLLNSRK